MSPRISRLVDLFWNLLIVGLINLFLDFIILYFVNADFFYYLVLAIFSTFVMASISGVVVFIRIKDRITGKLAYALIAFILSLGFFYCVTFFIATLPRWIFPYDSSIPQLQ